MRWYLTPSGVVLAASLSLLLVSLVVADAPWFTAVPAVGLLGAFLPYKFEREQRLQVQRAGEIESRLRSRIARLETALEDHARSQDEVIGAIATHTAEAIRVHAEALTTLDRGVMDVRSATRTACQDVA